MYYLFIMRQVICFLFTLEKSPVYGIFGQFYLVIVVTDKQTDRQTYAGSLLELQVVRGYWLLQDDYGGLLF